MSSIAGIVECYLSKEDSNCDYSQGMKSKISVLASLITICILFVPQPALSMPGDWPNCRGTCNAGDISAFKAYMVNDGLGNINIYGDITYTTSGTRYNMHVVYDIYKGTSEQSIDNVRCLGNDPSSPDGCVTPDPLTMVAKGIYIGTINYIPGTTDIYYLKNVLFLYDTNTQPCLCTSGDCGVFPTAKCKEISEVIVYPPPIISAGDDQEICLGESADLSVSVSPAGRTYSYAWTPTTGLSDSTIYNPIASPTTTTTYKVTVTDIEWGSSSSDFVTVTVYPLPIASFSVDRSSGCSPLSVTFTDTSSVPTGYTIVKWEWDFEDDGVINKIDTTKPDPFIHEYTEPGIFSANLTVTTNKGCVDSEKKTITATEPPDCTITADSVCLQALIDGTASVPLDPLIGTTYYWTVADSTQDLTIRTGQGTNLIKWVPLKGGPVNIGVTITHPSPSFCSCTNSETVMVYTKPEAEIIVVEPASV